MHDDLSARADQAAARGDVRTARGLLTQLTAASPDAVDAWLKLAAMCRADGDERAALAAVGGALRVEPLNFVALLLKASILEKTGAPAGEAWGNALAQRPSAPQPPAIERMIAHAAAAYDRHVAHEEARLETAMGSATAAADPDERRRLDRFRSNTLRKTRVYHSEPTHYHYPGLVEREFHDRGQFPWLEALEAATPAIRADFDRIVSAERAELVPYIQYPDDVPLRQWRGLNRSRDWTAIHLLRNGVAVAANAPHCVTTLRLLDAIPQPAVAGCSPNAMFSLLAPRTTIPPHNGVNNTRLVCHLPLIVPDGCRYRVGAETRKWEVGKAFVFDDTIEHGAVNDSDELRVVLIFDVWHPGLSAAERDGVTALLAACNSGDNGL